VSRRLTRLLVVCLGACPALGVRAQDAAPAPVQSELTTLEAVGDQQKGVWLTDYLPGMPLFLDLESVQFKPWAKVLFDARQRHDLEPHARCKASGGIRQFLTPYGVEIVEIEPLRRLYIFDIGGPHTFREVYMDGRSHPVDVTTSNYGHNIGWWQGNTLVVDSIGYNEDFWFERMGLPHTEAVHVVEYFERVAPDKVEYTFVLDDETAYDAPIEAHLSLYWREGEELFEYVCQQGNYAFDLMVHPDELRAIGTISPIVP
jgi:hypothetical protein